MSKIEIVAVIFGLLCVWLTVRENIWSWPTGLMQVSLYIIIFYQVKLYSDLILHIVYVGFQFYGWYHWLYGGKNRTQLPVTTLGWQARAAWLNGVVIYFALRASIITADASDPATNKLNRAKMLGPSNTSLR